MAIRRTLAEFSDDIATADIADDAITGGKLANNIAISTTGAITTTGAFTSVGIDDNAVGATAITIDSSENVGIGNAAPAAGSRLHIKGVSSANLQVEAPTDNATVTLQCGTDGSGNEGAFVNFIQNTTSKWQMGMNTDNSFRWYNYNTSSEAMQIDSSGNVKVNTGHLDLATASKDLQLSASGVVDFNGDELLYEEGTFSFTYYAPSGIGLSWTAQENNYVRLGRLVHINCNITFGTSYSDGNYCNMNLPFAASANQRAECLLSYTNITAGTPTYGNKVMFIDDDQSWLKFYITRAQTSGKILKFSLTYFTG